MLGVVLLALVGALLADAGAEFGELPAVVGVARHGRLEGDEQRKDDTELRERDAGSSASDPSIDDQTYW